MEFVSPDFVLSCEFLKTNSYPLHAEHAVDDEFRHAVRLKHGCFAITRKPEIISAKKGILTVYETHNIYLKSL